MLRMLVGSSLRSHRDWNLCGRLSALIPGSRCSLREGRFGTVQARTCRSCPGGAGSGNFVRAFPEILSGVSSPDWLGVKVRVARRAVEDEQAAAFEGAVDDGLGQIVIVEDVAPRGRAATCWW